MGLVAIPPGEMIEIDERYRHEMAERRDLLARCHAEVFAACPGSDLARQETLDRLATLLPMRFPGWFTRDGNGMHNNLTGEAWNVAHPPVDPLELAGRLVQEDLCLLDLSSGTPVLAAAVLCAPSRWRLTEKIGRPLIEVHAPVPGYAETLSKPVDRFMGKLRDGKLAMRLNWSVVDDDALFQQGGKHRTGLDPTITPGTAPVRLHLRVERQTLSRLPRSGFVLFTIRVHSTPLGRAITDRATAARLAAAVQAMPDAMAAYKSLPAFREALLGWLATFD
ncbi:MAG: DUF3445 domain-containing protein [Gemmatimonadaceae bacterium]|nr:DUF3445 domain-containing protein [Acetobacteraceae bacterium]